MSKFIVPIFASLTFGAALAVSIPASAQVGIEIGPRGPRVYTEEPTIVERRRRRVIEEEADRRTIIRRRVNRYGEQVEVRERVCD